MGDDQGPEPPDATRSGGTVPLEVIPLHSTNLLTVLDKTGTIQYESPSIERLYGYDQDELIGEQVTEYFHPDDRETVQQAFQTVVESEEYTVESVEYRHEQADGTYRWVESVASADPTPEGYYVINTRDISERKERERELERTNERLDQFASVISHDLRNPLNVAELRLDLAMQSGDSEHLGAVAEAHERMETLVDTLLTLSRAGEQVSEVDSVDLAALSKTCWRTVATGDATLELDIDRSVQANSSRLKQLLENLMRNAVEHGGDDVTITIGECAEEDGFYVADDGPGIQEHNRDQVLSSGYSTSSDGTGLGLTIVTDIAEAHGWDVDITESNAGGAEVVFTGVPFQ